MLVMSQMYKFTLLYKHWYDITLDADVTQKQVDEAEAQKKICAKNMHELLEKFQKIKIKSSDVSEWFAQRFERRVQDIVKIAGKGEGVVVAGIVLKELGNLVEIKMTEFVAPVPIWDTLTIKK